MSPSDGVHLLIWPPVDDERLLRIQAAVRGRGSVRNAQTLEEALASAADANVFFGKLTPELLEAAPSLRWVQSPTASLEHFLFPELVEHPCQLTNMRGIFSDVIADHVMGFVLTFARNLHLYRDQQALARWEPIGGGSAVPNFAQGPGVVSAVDRAHQHLSDCVLGVVGVGAIGEEVCRRAKAFGMEVLGVDPHPRSLPQVCDVMPLEALDILLEKCHYVVIAAPHTPQTQHLFNRERISRMRSDAVLINVGRGIIIQLDDLTDALRDRVIAGAALDVCETEPLPAAHPLWRMPNVVITPHVAAASTRISERHLQVLIENLKRFVTGQPLQNVVNKREWY